MRQRGFKKLGLAALVCGCSLFGGWLALGAPPSDKATELNNRRRLFVVNPQFPPTDAKATCTVTAPVFASWFESGSVALNGAVKPADSVNFSNPVQNCAFYQWSEQMFLWLTSPAPAKYGGGAHIFDSPAFYDVSPPGPGNQRTFIPHVNGRIRAFNLRVAQVGPHRLPVIFDKAGRMFEIEPPQPSVKPLVRNKAGNLVEIQRITAGPNGRRALLDPAGKEVELTPIAKQLPLNQARVTLTARKFTINEFPVFLDAFGNVIDVEQGQAQGNGVLEAQNGSLVYYATMVNDVYAYFLTGAKGGGITPAPTQFPTTQADLNKITAFASAHGKTFPDPNALAIEVKTSWIEAAGLPNLSSYITMTATIPTYNTSNPDQWTPNGQKNALLALVGIHVVGSTKGHPEMIWATFEHFNNAPRGTYAYINSSNATTTVNQSSAGAWLFTATNSAGPFNDLHMHFNSPPPPPLGILANPPFHISKSDTIRWKTWGAASDVTPNPLTASTASSNTEVIAINNSVLGSLAAGDVRGNYIMSGATWTAGGAPPSGSFKNPGGGNEVGTSKLANSTMETYQQGTNTLWATGTNCFSCHNTNQTGVSHVYPDLQKLF